MLSFYSCFYLRFSLSLRKKILIISFLSFLHCFAVTTGFLVLKVIFGGLFFFFFILTAKTIKKAIIFITFNAFVHICLTTSFVLPIYVLKSFFNLYLITRAFFSSLLLKNML
jgi:hypothetical protein